MPAPSPRTWNVNDLETAALFNANIRDVDNFLLGGYSGGRPAFEITNNTALPITNATLTIPAGGSLTVVTDTDNGFIPSTGTYVIQTNGFWLFTMLTSWASNSSGVRISQPTSDIGSNPVLVSAAVDANGNARTVWTQRQPNGYPVTPYVYQNSGGTLNLTGYQFSGIWLSNP